MSEDKDFKEEDKTSQENGQPEKKETDDLEGDKSEEDEKSEEETVQISKSELQKLQKDSKDKENYKQGLLTIKRKGRAIPEAEPVKKEDDELTEDFVTKKDFQKQIEKSAIKEASKDSEVDENWDSIMEFYNARHGKDTIEDILADIEIAHRTWKVQQPLEKPKDDEDKKSASDLAKDAGLSKGLDKISKPVKKSIIPKKEKMSEWYGK